MASTANSIAASPSKVSCGNSGSCYADRLLCSMALAGGLLEFWGAGKREFHGMLEERVEGVQRFSREHAI